MASMVRVPRILQKFYIYDPNVSDTLGGLRVMEEKDDKGNVKEGRRHVLAVSQQIQYWIDQGLMGDKPVNEISPQHKKLLEQVTRGRSKDNDEDPKRVPKYDRVTQSGSPSLAGRASRRVSNKKKKDKVAWRKSENKAVPPQSPPPKSS